MILITDPTRVTTNSEHLLMGLGWQENRAYLYVQANGAISIGAVCDMTEAGQADELDSARAASINGSPLGAAQVAIPDDSYGWIQVYGPCGRIQVAGTVTAGDYVWATTTDGALDDTDVANTNIHGIRVAARTNAGNTSGFLNWPGIQGDG